MPTKATKTTKPVKARKTSKATATAKTSKPRKTVKATKPVKTVKATKTVKAAKVKATTAKAATKDVKDARESNRLRQQRFLESHREEINDKRRERYAMRKESGRCPRCGKKLKSLKLTLCKDCLEKAREYNKR